MKTRLMIRERCRGHIMCPRSTPFPDRFGGGASATSFGLAQLLSRASAGNAAATSCDLALILSQPRVSATGLRPRGVLLGNRSRCPRTIPTVDSTMLQLARCFLFKGDKLPVAINPDTFEGNRGRRTPSRDTPPVSLHWRHCSIRGQIDQKGRRCTHEFPSQLLVTTNQAPSRRTRGRPSSD